MSWCVLLVLMFTSPLHPDTDLKKQDKREKPVTQLEQAVVTGLSPLIRTGEKRTEIDSSALKENISQSLSDILFHNSAIFVKQAGRNASATVSFRGTSASHTQVLWNGLKISSPMLGMMDFSMIPAFLIDRTTILHGSSSIQETSGGLGGAVLTRSVPVQEKGFGLQYIQGIGSYTTFEEFLNIKWGGETLKTSTKVFFSSSRNNFRFTNLDKMENIYDGNHNIIDRYHPVERLRSGDWKDLHIMQDLFWNITEDSRLSLSLWYIKSDRGVPPISVDYSDNIELVNRQKEETIRGVLSWKRTGQKSYTEISAAGAGTWLDYDYARGKGNGELTFMTKARNRAVTTFVKGLYRHYFSDKLILSGKIDLQICSGRNADKVSSAQWSGIQTEASAVFSAKWRPWKRLGLAMDIREELHDREFSPVIPVFNFEILLSEKWKTYIKGSASRNYRYPSLNDLYFVPGGNPDLNPEKGFAYDIGYSFDKIFPHAHLRLCAEGSWFDSYMDDWILWVPFGAKKNFMTPLNLQKVHAYGIEQSIKLECNVRTDWKIYFNGNFTWSPSINQTSPSGSNDISHGKQLPYDPRVSASFTAGVSFRKWELLYKWCHYSKRYTMTSNEESISGAVLPYFMNDITVSRLLEFKFAGIKLSCAVKNLFNEKYVSVLSRPMPGINFEFFIAVTPNFNIRKNK